MRTKLILVAVHVYHRRARYTMIGTALTMFTIMHKPNDRWSEYEKDFKMYDEFANSR